MSPLSCACPLSFFLADLSPVGVKQLSGGDTSKGTWASKWVCQVCALDFQQKGSEFVPGE